jgi:hypothetical protein
MVNGKDKVSVGTGSWTKHNHVHIHTHTHTHTPAQKLYLACSNTDIDSTWILFFKYMLDFVIIHTVDKICWGCFMLCCELVPFQAQSESRISNLKYLPGEYFADYSSTCSSFCRQAGCPLKKASCSVKNAYRHLKPLHLWTIMKLWSRTFEGYKHNKFLCVRDRETEISMCPSFQEKWLGENDIIKKIFSIFPHWWTNTLTQVYKFFSWLKQMNLAWKALIICLNKKRRSFQNSLAEIWKTEALSKWVENPLEKGVYVSVCVHF